MRKLFGNMRFLCFVALSSMVFFAGCQPGDQATKPSEAGDHASHGHSHGHDHDHEMTLSDSVGKVVKLSATIRDAYKAGKPDDAHGALHDIGHVLECIPEAAKKEGLSTELQASIKTSVDTLFSAFGALDEKMHGEKGKEFEAVDGEIDTALASLTKSVSGK